MSINKGTPFIYHEGIRDESARRLLPEPLLLPQHLPIFYIQAERGRTTPHFLSGTELTRMYGTKSFDEREKWYSHQTQAAMLCNSNANLVCVRRLTDATAKKASLRVSVEIGDDTFKPYQRNANGSVVVDVLGVKQRDTAGTDVNGKIMRILVEEVPLNGYATGVKVQGAAYGSAANQSDIFPIFDFEIDSEGAYGNNIGMRLWYPHDGTAAPGDIQTMEDTGYAIFRAQLVERINEIVAPVVTSNLDGSRETDFALGDKVLNDRTNRVYDWKDLYSGYTDQTEGQQPIYGPFGRVHFYKELHEELVTALKAVEDVATPEPVDANSINWMNAVDMNGHDYYAFYMDSTGTSLDQFTTLYCEGGSDGVVNEATLDTLVKTEVTTNWENPEVPIVDDAQYPFSVVYDTGFSTDTKSAILSTMGLRGDITIGCCTQDLSQPENDQASERSMATTLRTAARLVPESIIHGTDCCRAVIVGDMGTYKDSIYKRRLPLLFDLIHKRSKYMGASNGRMNNVYAYDIAPNNRLQVITEPNHTWKSKRNRDLDWEAGLNYIQYANMNEIFWPAYQTVYSNDTSIINSEINMLIAVDVIKIQRYLWTEFTGRSDLTAAQFIERHDERFLELVAGRYDNRVTIQSETYFTAADEVRGYSWSHSANIYGNVMKTVAQMRVTARRQTDLEA